MPRKPKGRGRGLGRGRGRGQQQQEKRPGGLHSAEGSSQSSSSTEPHHSLPQKLGDQSSLQKDQKEEKDVAQSAAVVSRSFLESGETGLKETRSSDESLRSESESTQAKRAAARRQEREKTSELTKPAKDVSATSSLATSPGLGVDSSHTEVSPSQAGARPKQREKDKTGKIHLSSQVQNQKQSPVPQSSAAREPARPQEPEVEARGGTKATRSVDRLAKQDSEVTVTHTTALAEHQRSLRPPRRPDFGKAGKPIKLHANFFKLQVPNNHFMYHYDVEIEPSRCPRHVNHQVIDAVIQKYSKNTFLGRRPAFDGKKNIYSREKLPVGKDGVVLDVALPGEDGGKDRKYKVI